MHGFSIFIFPPDLLPARNGEEFTEYFLHEMVDIFLSYIKKTYDGKSKVLDFHHPHQLLEGLEGFSMELPDQPEPLEQILVDCRDTLKYGVKTGKVTGVYCVDSIAINSDFFITGLKKVDVQVTCKTCPGECFPSSFLLTVTLGCVDFISNISRQETGMFQS